MKFFDAKTPEEVELFLHNYSSAFKKQTESLNLHCVSGRTLSKSIKSTLNVPEFNRSIVDGYAIIASNSYGASPSIPSMFNLLGEVRMGETTDLVVHDFECVYVPTGGMIPSGADAMVMIEDSENFDETTIAIYKSTPVDNCIIHIGDDIKKNEVVLKEGTKITGKEIGVLAALGINEIDVYKRISVSVFSTGDEIIDIDEPLTLGKVRDINGYVLVDYLNTIGCHVVEHSIIKDDFDTLLNTLKNAMLHSDIILLSGGSSVGVRDYTCQVIESFDSGKVHIHGMTVKPGKPTIVGTVEDKLIIGLPGHPVSSTMVYKGFIEPFIESMMGCLTYVKTLEATLNVNVHSAPGKRTYQMVTVKGGEVTPLHGKSGMITLLSQADGYFVMGRETEGQEKGSLVTVYLF